MMGDPLIDTGGSAFPAGNATDIDYGMTLLDWFAGQALAGFLANCNSSGSRAAFTKDAYDYATAMITEKRRREK